MVKPIELLRVTFQTRRETGTKTVKLGFIKKYNPNLKSHAKDIKIQDDWAYGIYGHVNGNYTSAKYEIREDGYYREYYKTNPDGRWIFDENKNRITDFYRVEEELQPKIYPNVPLSGFSLDRTVSRSTTSNKLFRINDPRGFQVEISAANLFEIATTGVINSGILIGEFIYEGKQLVRYVDDTGIPRVRS